jgi:hypothetical protein
MAGLTARTQTSWVWLHSTSTSLLEAGAGTAAVMVVKLTDTCKVSLERLPHSESVLVSVRARLAVLCSCFGVGRTGVSGRVSIGNILWVSQSKRERHLLLPAVVRDVVLG